MTIQAQLFALQDEAYREFHCRLMPTVAPERVIGVRTPALRAFAKSIRGQAETQAWLAELPHTYYEENNLHGMLICEIREYGAAVEALDRFLPYVDNWATCDLLKPKAFAKNKDRLLPDIRRWMRSEHVYTCRFGIGMLMCHFLDGDFKPEYLQWVADVPENGEYYIMMMKAWYFATALAKQYDAALPLLETGVLPRETHNKTIQKAVESLRITDAQKQYLKTRKR